MTTWEDYDATTLAAVFDTLASVKRCFGAAAEHLTVVGGIAPSLLVPFPKGSAHVGTTDIDLCLTVALAAGDTGYYDEVHGALERAGFVQRSQDPLKRWKWEREGIEVDFLYPAGPGERPMMQRREMEQWEPAAQASLGEQFSALAVGYPNLVDADRRLVPFQGRVDGALVDDHVHVTGPTALCALKAAALGSRNKRKDAYDIVWTLDQIGIEQAAGEALALAAHHEGRAGEVRAAAESLASLFEPGRSGPVWYALFLEGFEPGADRDQLERFAEETVGPYAQAILGGTKHA